MNPYERYQEQMVTTMTQGDMLIKLYDESIKQIQIARSAIEAGNIPDMDKALTKTLKVIRYLRSTLDFRYPISNNLAQLYDFFDSQLVMANVKKDSKLLDDIEPLVQDMRGTFAECDKINRTNRVGMAVGDTV